MFYPLIIVTTEEEMALLDMYCEGRSFIWRMFFGWRRTKKVGTMNWYYYRVPKRICLLVEEYAKKYLGVTTIS